MRRSLDNLIEGCQLISFDWRYLYVNKAALKQSKFTSKKDLIGFTMMEKYPGIDNAEMFQVLKTCMEERVSKEMENEFVFPDNTKGWFELRIRPVPEGIFILSVEITERKKAEQAREAHIKGLEEMMFTISHKMRQPIANIMGIDNLLNSSELSQEELHTIMDHISFSIHSLDSFTKELVELIDNQVFIGKDKVGDPGEKS